MKKNLFIKSILTFIVITVILIIVRKNLINIKYEESIAGELKKCML